MGFIRYFQITPFLFMLITMMSCNGVKEEEVLASLKGVSDQTSLEITPSLSAIYINQTQQFIATGGKTPYTFSVLSGSGSISTSGLYTATSSTGISTVQVMDASGSTREATVFVDSEISLGPATLKINVNSTLQFETNGGTPPYSYSVISGSSTFSSTGLFTASAAPESITLRVTDSTGAFAESAVDVGNGPIISPVTASIPINDTYQFSTTSGTAPLTWSVVSGGGSVSAAGLYTAPATTGQAKLRVTDINGFYSEADVTLFKRKQVALGASHTCVLNQETNTVKCVGLRANGQTGDGKFVIGDSLDDMGDNLESIKWVAPDGVSPTKLASTLHNTCAIFSDGLTRCIGYSGYGQNGNNMVQNAMIFGSTEATMVSVPADVGNPIVDLATKGGSYYHQCGIYQDGTAKCWGYNGYGQLGKDNLINYGSNYTTASLYTVAPIALGQTVRKIETGYIHTCAILNDKNVKCWGYNAYGQLGHGNNTPQGDAPGEMATIPTHNFAQDVVDIALGHYHTCAILDGGNVTCWGYSGNGELGTGTTLNYGDEPGENPTLLAPVDLGTGRTAVKIDAGYNHTCALLDNDQVKCWGYNGYGQLGQEDNVARGAFGILGDSLPEIYLGVGRTAVDIFVGGNSTCVLLDSGDTKCFGYNGESSLGIGLNPTQNQGDGPNEMGDFLPAVNWGSNVTAVHNIVPHQYSTCALVTDNGNEVIKCLGRNESGSLGIENVLVGDQPNELGSAVVAVDLGNTKTIVDITAGIHHTCARFSDGTGKCWGYNSSAVLGTNGAGGLNIGNSHWQMGTNLSYVIQGSGVSASKYVASKSGNYSACGIFNNTLLKCWGYNGYGQLGQNTTAGLTYIPAIGSVNLVSPRYAVDVSMGAYHTCAVLDNGAVKCWGYNTYGNLGYEHVTQLGDTAGEMAVLPAVNLGAGVLASSISLGEHHSCVVTTLGKVKCWGYNASGQLGHGHLNNIGDGAGEMGNSLPYVNLGTGRTAIKLASGRYHNCALLDNKKVKCWGYNAYGNLGNESTVSYGGSAMGDSVPYVNLGTGRTALDIVAGYDHTCAVLDNNDVKCWGNNDSAQLGYGHLNRLGDNMGEMGNNLRALGLD